MHTPQYSGQHQLQETDLDALTRHRVTTAHKQVITNSVKTINCSIRKSRESCEKGLITKEHMVLHTHLNLVAVH